MLYVHLMPVDVFKGGLMEKNKTIVILCLNSTTLNQLVAIRRWLRRGTRKGELEGWGEKEEEKRGRGNEEEGRRGS